ncbi:MAG: M28 family peptidase [Clostridiales bacterium]|nr:M28 family peptidase [Clostridiales bacterium]
MAKLKKIYYPILAGVFVLALIFGFISSGVSFGTKADNDFVEKVRVHAEVMETVHNSYEHGNQTSVRNYIKDTLIGAGFTNPRGKASDGYATATIDGPTYVAQELTLGEETLSAIPAKDGELYYAVKTLTNIIVAIPGKTVAAEDGSESYANSEVVLFMANYDSAAGSQSGTEAIQAAAMLQTVLELAADYENGKIPERTLLFVFTDAEHEGALGAYAFKNEFKGFDGITSNVSLAVSFGATGTGALSVSSEGISVAGVKANASGLLDALGGVNQAHTDYNVFDTAKINVFFGGNQSYINTTRDTVENVADSKIKAVGGAMKSLVSAYGYDGKEIKEANAVGVFSFLGLAFSYSPIVSYVLGGVAAALLIFAVYMLVRKGGYKGVVGGVVAQLIAVVATVIMLFACYFVLALMLAGFGAIPIHALTSVTYTNVGLFISAMILALVAYIGSFLLIRRFYKIEASKVVRGGALWLMILGIVMAFAMPSAALPFAITAILEGAILVLNVVFGDKFKAKYGFGVERLFSYTLPLIVLTPAVVPVLIGASYTLSAVYLPLILGVAVLGFSVIAPYFLALRPMLERAVSKLPKHTIRVERVVTEKVEGAKKGRFEERTTKKVVKEKVEWKYHNRYGVAILAVFAAFLIIMFAVCPKQHFSTNIVDTYSYREAAKNDSLVYTWQQVGTSSATQTLNVYDQVAYKYFGSVNNDYTWNADEQAYQKSFSGSTEALLGTLSPINVSMDSTEKTLTFETYDSGAGSFIDITLTNVSYVTKLVISTGSGDIEIINDGNSTIHFELPYDVDTFTVKLECERAFTLGVDYTQYVTGDRTEQRMKGGVSEYTEILGGLGDKEFVDDITCGMIFNRQTTFSLS